MREITEAVRLSEHHNGTPFITERNVVKETKPSVGMSRTAPVLGTSETGATYNTTHMRLREDIVLIIFSIISWL